MRGQQCGQCGIGTGRTGPGTRLVILLKLGTSSESTKNGEDEAQNALRHDHKTHEGNSGHSKSGTAARLHSINALVDLSNNRVHVEPRVIQNVTDEEDSTASAALSVYYL